MHCVLSCKVILSDYKDSWVIVRPSPLIENGLPAMLGAIFFSVEIRACRAGASPSQPQSAALTAPFRDKRPAPPAPAGGSAASTSLRKSRSRSATAADAAFGLRPQNGVPILYPIFGEISGSNLSEFVWS